MSGAAWRAVLGELAPADGRFAATWRVAAVCALTTAVFMTYQIPLVAIACYLVLFVMKPDPAESLLMAIGIAALVSVVVLGLIFLVQFTIDAPVARMASLVLGSFLFLFIGAASKLGPAGSIIALVIGFIMTLIGLAPSGEVATRGVLYAWLMALVPMAVIVAFTAVAGRSPLTLLRRGLAGRLRLIAQALQSPSTEHQAQLLAVLRSGNAEFKSYAKVVSLFHLAPTGETRALKAAIERSYAAVLTAERLLDALGATSNGSSASHLAATVASCEQLADAAERGALGDPMCRSSDVSGVLAPSLAAVVGNDQAATGARWQGLVRSLQDQLSLLVTESPPAQPDAVDAGFFFADAFTNPAYLRFALKTTAAAVFCYLIYTALDWQDIHTAMITCYVAALGTTGETLHKLTLRIVGCLIGAAMGVLAIVFLMPLMTSIGELMLLVFCGSLVAAWVASGSERSAYAGVQIGLAFLLTVLQGFGPDVQLSVAYDRIVGILLGNAVLYLVFTRVWPVSAQRALHAQLDNVIHLLQPPSGSSVLALTPAQAQMALVKLNGARDQLTYLHFEPRYLRPSGEYFNQQRRLIRELEAFCLEKAELGLFTPANAAQTGAAMPFATLAQWNARIVQLRQLVTSTPP